MRCGLPRVRSHPVGEPVLAHAKLDLAAAEGGDGAAVDEQIDAGDERGAAAQQELGDRGDVVGRTEPSGGRRGDESRMNPPDRVGQFGRPSAWRSRPD